MRWLKKDDLGNDIAMMECMNTLARSALSFASGESRMLCYAVCCWRLGILSLRFTRADTARKSVEVS